MNLNIKSSLLSFDIAFVNKSARFVAVSSFATLIIPAATASWHRWYAIALCFFDRVDSGFLVFLVTDSMSQKTSAGPSISIPNVLNLYQNALIISTAVFIAMYSLPKVDPSTVDCLLEYQGIGAWFKNIIIPVCEQRVTTSQACEASTKYEMDTGVPLGTGRIMESPL